MTVTWQMVALMEVGLLLIGVAFHVGLDVPWLVALFPFYMPPIVVCGSVLALRLFRII